MNILVINGSPKGERSNTYRLTSAFLEGIRAGEERLGHQSPKAEVLDVCKLDLRPCLGCFSCWNKTPGECCLHDDMRTVIEKLLWADLTIWSFPLYYFGIPGPMKNLIDRQLPMNLPFMRADTQSGGHPARYEKQGQKTVLISTCGFYTARGNYDSVTSMFDRLCGKGNYTSLFCGQGELFRVKELASRTDEYLSFVRKAGEEYALGSISHDTLAKLSEDLYPRDVFEAMADASWGVDKSGKKEDDSLAFTKQMAALYNKTAWPGHDILLEMNYTDIDKAYRILLTRDGSQVTEGLTGDNITTGLTGDNVTVSPTDHSTTRINTPYSVWRQIAAGEIAGDAALMKHLYTVEGDFDLMLHWDDYFGAGQTAAGNATNKENDSKTDHKTNMTWLLIPWIVFWVAAAISSFWGSLISLAACVLVPLLMFRAKATIYDRLSLVGVGGCCIALLAGASPLLMIPLSYFLFGLMWVISCFTKVPLTAHYSKNSYNGDAALNNPLFMKTNLILTAAWGILYLLTPIWTYFIMRTNAGSFVGAINSVLPALMGLFTAWFQKWYPRHVASGPRT